MVKLNCQLEKKIFLKKNLIIIKIKADITIKKGLIKEEVKNKEKDFLI